jgi:DHA1 family bicyclomycin/chloramphenicol resistance-like MFS transporter
MTKRTLSPDSPWLLVVLATLVALGPLSVDMYIPAMPTMQEDLGASISQMHLTLSAYLTGFAVFHLACGPLADRYGRKPVLLWGSIIFVFACVGCSLSDSIGELLLFRLLQGVGACVGPTIARTIVRDVFGAKRAARAFSIMAMMMALAPAIAPTIGGAMLLVLPWSSIFVFLAGYGLFTIVLVQYFIAESLPVKQSIHPRAIVRNFTELIRDPLFLLITMASALMYATLLTYLSSSAFVYINMLGVPIEYFGLVFLTGVGGYIIGSALSARYSMRYPPEQLSLKGTQLGVAATLLMLLCSELYSESVAAYMLPMMIVSTSLGLVLPNAMAVALRPFPHIAGTASSLMGFIQMSTSAVASAAVGSVLTTTPRPMVVAMVIISILALTLNVIMYKRVKTMV